ncbi:DnaT-like ssDNA-binding protein [Pseudomonas putida]
MIIVEHGQGTDPAANSYADADSLRFHGEYYGFPVPPDEAGQVEYLLKAGRAMDAMRWKGVPASANQPLAWPRDGIVLAGEFLSRSLIPYGIRHGQVMLAIELYADGQGIELVEPTHGFDGKKSVPLTRSTEAFRNHPPLWVASRTQFADYLVMRGLTVIA